MLRARSFVPVQSTRTFSMPALYCEHNQPVEHLAQVVAGQALVVEELSVILEPAAFPGTDAAYGVIITE
jgi:hypothetical protein